MSISAYIIIGLFAYLLIGLILSIFDKAYNWGAGSLMVLLWFPIASMLFIWYVAQIIAIPINFTNKLSSSISKRIKKESK